MSDDCHEVLNAALQLSAEDRGLIAEMLLETLFPEGTELSDDELEVRLEEGHRNPAATVSWSALRDEP